ncbi:unnamed protein product [Penicillium manginii]
MADPRHGSLGYRDLARQHGEELESLLQQGIFKPVFLYQAMLFNLLPLLGLIVPRHRGGKYIRSAIFALNLGIAFQVLKNHRAHLGGNGYMFGLIAAWSLIWSAGILVFTDIEKDFQRIERMTAAESESTKLAIGTRGPSGNVQPEPYGKDAKVGKFHWQPYPHKLSHRLGWCAGLLFNLRGPEWNWRAPHLGPLPRSIHSQLHAGFGSNKHRFQAVDDSKYLSANRRLKRAFRTFLISYLLLDCLKAVMMRDPYFRGSTITDSPPFPFSYFEPFPILIRFYHVFISAMGVYVALNFVTSLSPIIFLGLSRALPNASRKFMTVPLDASWLYADSFGPFLEPLLDHGLAGCWGRWWHQLFRHGFTMAAGWILSLLPIKLAQNVQLKRMIHVVVAFSLSGFIHACGSYTQFTATRPFSGPFLFFFMQSIGVIGEYIFKTAVFPKLRLPKLLKGFRRAGNAIFVISWLLFSGPHIADDFARGGLWWAGRAFLKKLKTFEEGAMSSR